MDVIYFVREVVEEYPTLRAEILAKLIENFDSIRNSQVFKVALWILGEYAGESSLDIVLSTIRDNVGAVPLIHPKKADADEDEEEDPFAAPVKASSGPRGPVVLADGTYASQSASAAAPEAAAAAADSTPGTSLRSLLMNGDYFIGACLSCAMTKLAIRFSEANGVGTAETNEEFAKTMLMLVSIIRLGGPGHPDKKYIDIDSSHRINLCIRVLLDPAKYKETFMEKSRETFAAMLQDQRNKLGDNKKVAKIRCCLFTFFFF